MYICVLCWRQGQTAWSHIPLNNNKNCKIYINSFLFLSPLITFADSLDLDQDRLFHQPKSECKPFDTLIVFQNDFLVKKLNVFVGPDLDLNRLTL